MHPTQWRQQYYDEHTEKNIKKTTICHEDMEAERDEMHLSGKVNKRALKKPL